MMPSRRCYMLGSIGNSEVYVPLAKYSKAKELDGIKIFQFCGPIHYVCADLFERLLRQKTGVDVKQVLRTRDQQKVVKEDFPEAKPSLNDGDSENNCDSGNSSPTSCHRTRPSLTTSPTNLPTHIILDFSMISYIDSAGIHVIKKIIDDYKEIDVIILIASMASHVAEMVRHDPTLWVTHKQKFHYSLTEAVSCAIRESHSRHQQRMDHEIVTIPRSIES